MCRRPFAHASAPVPPAASILGDLDLDLRRHVLHAGDVVVQRGTDHAWENRSSQPARMAFFHIDAQFGAELLAVLPKPLELMR